MMNRLLKKGKFFFLGTLLFTLLCFTALADDGITVDPAHFPDDAFRNYVLEHIDTNKDGVLYPAEISVVTLIDVSGRGVSRLDGIEYMTYLKLLNCFDNKLTALDISKNKALTNLSCQNNQLTELDVSGNPKIEDLACFNNGITSLDVSKCRNLRYLYCSGNQMTELKLGSLGNLRYLYCFDNRLSSLDLSGCPYLEKLYCYNNQISTLDLSDKFGLFEMNCGQNPIQKLDISNCQELEELYCYECQLTELNLTNNEVLNLVQCNANRLSALDVSHNENLHYLVCNKNDITALTVSKCQALDDLIKNQQPAYIDDQVIYWGTPQNTNNPCLYIDRGVKVTYSGGEYVSQLPVTGIQLNRTSAVLTRTYKKPKPTVQLKATITPANAGNTNLKWYSSNKKVATVSQSGKVTARGAGKAKIICEATDGSGVRAVCKITVKDKKITKIGLKKKKVTLKVGKKLTLKVKITPSSALNRKLKWTSSNEKVATVNSEGIVKARGKGQCIITCKATDGSEKKATCRITVK